MATEFRKAPKPNFFSTIDEILSGLTQDTEMSVQLKSGAMLMASAMWGVGLSEDDIYDVMKKIREKAMSEPS